MIAEFTYVAFAAPDQPASVCPEWAHCLACNGHGDITTLNRDGGWVSETCPKCNGSGIVETTTNQPL